LQYDHRSDSLRGFSWWHGIGQFARQSLFSSPLGVWNGIPDLPKIPTYRLEPGQPAPGWPTLPRHPFAQTSLWWYRNINLFPITYAFRPRLRSRLTLSGLALLRKPEAFGEKVFHLFYRYSCQQNLFRFVDRSSRSGFTLQRNAPLPMRIWMHIPQLWFRTLAPLNLRREFTFDQ
jgi:hypothetical protein